MAVGTENTKAAMARLCAAIRLHFDDELWIQLFRNPNDESNVPAILILETYDIYRKRQSKNTFLGKGL